mmetsp:Transcript_27156/g.90261  ORF Transcript_27156/g.90261 Transcript_27156/m.90261 type:complete len:280 (-) Transcript_27156:1855-2694(-)
MDSTSSIRAACQACRLFWSCVVSNGLRTDIAPQMLMQGPGTPSRQPSTRILPSLGWHGSAAKCRPKGVSPSCSFSSKAPRSWSAISANCTAPLSGGSGVFARKPGRSAIPEAQTCRYTFSRGTRCISGGVTASNLSMYFCGSTRKQTPGWTRPARPRRCLRESNAHHCSRSIGVLLYLSTFVEQMIFRVHPGGRSVWKHVCCSSGGKFACKGNTHHLVANSLSSCSLVISCDISPRPGKNIRIAPLCGSLGRCLAAPVAKVQAPSGERSSSSMVWRMRS